MTSRIMRMTDPNVEDVLEQSIRILLPYRHEMTVAIRVLIGSMSPVFPWSCSISQVTAGSDIRKLRIPVQLAVIDCALLPSFFCVDRTLFDDNGIIAKVEEKGLSCILFPGHIGKGTLNINHGLKSGIQKILCRQTKRAYQHAQ